MPTPPPAGPSILYENQGVNYSPFSLDPHAADSAAIATQGRMQIAAGTFPMHYLGDQSQSNLATSASVELPVLKMTEEEQEVWEGVFRTLADLAIKRAVDAGWLSTTRDPTDDERERMAPSDPNPVTGEVTPGEKIDAYDPATDQMERDLSYSFAMPNPLQRALPDLVAAISTIAATFDPADQNVALSRFLLGLILEQGFDVDDPKRIVDEVFPSNYQPPEKTPPIMVVNPDGSPAGAAGGRGRGASVPPAAAGGALGQDGKRHPATNPYGSFKTSAAAGKSVQEAEDVWTAYGVTPEQFAAVIEEAAVRAQYRGLRPRPGDPTFERISAEFLRETRDNLGELVAAARSDEGDAGA
jgi:hypothetical protein